jgi:hypothetical protein
MKHGQMIVELLRKHKYLIRWASKSLVSAEHPTFPRVELVFTPLNDPVEVIENFDMGIVQAYCDLQHDQVWVHRRCWYCLETKTALPSFGVETRTVRRKRWLKAAAKGFALPASVESVDSVVSVDVKEIATLTEKRCLLDPDATRQRHIEQLSQFYDCPLDHFDAHDPIQCQVEMKPSFLYMGVQLRHSMPFPPVLSWRKIGLPNMHHHSREHFIAEQVIRFPIARVAFVDQELVVDGKKGRGLKLVLTPHGTFSRQDVPADLLHFMNRFTDGKLEPVSQDKKYLSDVRVICNDMTRWFRGGREMRHEFAQDLRPGDVVRIHGLLKKGYGHWCVDMLDLVNPVIWDKAWQGVLPKAK